MYSHSVGLTVGAVVGDVDGDADGELDGDADGEPDGDVDGDVVGAVVGATEGARVHPVQENLQLLCHAGSVHRPNRNANRHCSIVSLSVNSSTP